MNFIDHIILKKSKNLLSNLIRKFPEDIKFIDEEVFYYFNFGEESTKLDSFHTQFGHFDFLEFDGTFP